MTESPLSYFRCVLTYIDPLLCGIFLYYSGVMKMTWEVIIISFLIYLDWMTTMIYSLDLKFMIRCHVSYVMKMSLE